MSGSASSPYAGQTSSAFFAFSLHILVTCMIMVASLVFLAIVLLACTSEAFVAPPLTSPSIASPVVRWSSSAPAAPEQDVTDAASKKYVTGTGDDAFSMLAELASSALIQSDMRRDAKGDKGGKSASGPSSATNWIDDQSAYALQQALNKLSLKLPNQRKGVERDNAGAWLRWMKASPTVMQVDLSKDLQSIANTTISDKNLDLLDTTREDFLSRLGCKLLLFPSGAELKAPLVEPTGALNFGKLLYGGVTRYRLLSSSNSARPPRRAGESMVSMSTAKDSSPSWIVYGGSERMYEAVDMGAAAVLEVTLLPIGKAAPNLFNCKRGGDMALGRLNWSPTDMFSLETEESEDVNDIGTLDSSLSGSTPMSLSGRERNNAFAKDFRVSVGGLSDEINQIVRRVLDGRVLRPADEDDSVGDEGDSTNAELSAASMEAEELAALGLSPVKGLLLYGPPGCGKTALAREISRALRARKPKIITAPELLDRWVGGSEALVRSLFAEAEAELAACNGEASKSALHVIVIDEIDAVFRKRTSAEDSGEATRSSVVNQILAKLDGVSAIPNVLLVGMTNRRELLDDALLRPGRLEVQIEIPKPNKQGRREILKIHFEALRNRGRLSQPLCCAIDGVVGYDSETHTTTMSGATNSPEAEVEDDSSSSLKRVKGRKRRAIKKAVYKVMDKVPVVRSPVFDLAAATVGFSGADIAGLVRCAGSIALSRARNDGNGIEGLLITLHDVKQALEEVKD